MTLRHQPPAWSPVSPGAIARGLGARRDPAVLERLAADLASRFGAAHVRLTGSGTLALTLAMRAAARDPGGPVVALPAWGCYDLASAADGAEARVRLYDLDPRTLGPDPASLRRALAAGVDAVVFAHLFGVPVPIPEFAAEVRSSGAAVVDDAAQGTGGTAVGRPLGSAGDWGVLSFGRGKGRTGGRGGALLAFGPERAVQAAGITLDPADAGVGAAGLLAALWLLARPGLYWIPAALPWLRLGETIYHPPPAHVSLSPLAAGVLLAGAAQVAEEDARRRAAATWWSEAVAGLSGIEPIAPPAGVEPGWLRFPVLVSPDLVAGFSSPGLRRLGVMPGYPKPLAALAGFQHRVRTDAGHGWPGAELLARRLFTLPTHGRVMPRDRDRLLSAVRALARA